MEHRGVSIDYFKKCVDEGLEFIVKLKEGGSKCLLQNREWRMDKEGEDMFNDDLIYRMASIGVPRNEPVFASLVEKMIRKEVDATR